MLRRRGLATGARGSMRCNNHPLSVLSRPFRALRFTSNAVKVAHIMDTIEGLRKFSRKDESILSVYRQLVSNGGIEITFAGLVTVKLQEHDLRRVQNIINEVDDRRVFYSSIQDETPEFMVRSVLDAKRNIHNLRQDIWANDWARKVIQLLLEKLGGFLTFTERNTPRSFNEPGFSAFEDAALHLRLNVWTIVAHLVVVFGKQVTPRHLPKEIADVVREAYDIEQKKKR
jgi:hypothetical protein